MSDDPVESVVWMVRGAWVTMSLRAACRLEVFDLLDEPRTTTELAALADADAGAMTRLARVLADLGLLVRLDDGRVSRTRTGETLCSGHPSGLRDLVLMQSWLPNLAAWNHLTEAVRAGSSVYEQVNGVSSWQHLSEHPDVGELFNGAMARRAAGQVQALLAAVDLTEVNTVVDVGGGRGAMLAGLLQAHPHLTGIVADRPDVATEADRAFETAGLASRAHAVAADFFESVPSGGDLYTISNVLHDWDDADCVRILRTVRAAIDEGSRLVVVERVLGVPGRTPEDARDLDLVDLHMLVMFGARERTVAEYDALLVRAGFVAGHLHETGTSWNVIETGPAAGPGHPE